VTVVSQIEAMTMLRVGVAKADITPHAGIEMAGFGKRIQPSLGVNDPLYATAMVADDGQGVVAVVDCDLLMVSAEFTAAVREKACGLAGIPAANVMVMCTHTHYGPGIPSAAANGVSSYAHAYREWLAHQLAGLIFEAKANLRPAQMRWGLGQSDIGVNRREKMADGRIVLGENPDGAIDQSVGVCRIDGTDGTPLVSVVNFAAHPVGQDVQVRKISADYVGRVRQVVEQATGEPCMFWQGACGNINIRQAETDYANVHSRGEGLGQEAMKVWETAQRLEGEDIHIISRDVELAPFRCLSRQQAEQQRLEAQQDLEAARKNPGTTPGLLAWLENDVKRLVRLRDSWTDPALVPPPVKAQLQACRIGGLAWVCVPGELFNELGCEIKKRSPHRPTFVVTYVNDWIGYLPTQEAFQEGGYEVSQVCYLAPEGMRALVDECVEMAGVVAG
jgi:hypothetical protein